jgi:hypothetical protein
MDMTYCNLCREDGFLTESKEDEDNDYAKRLKEELELVTDQLIEMEQRLCLTVPEDQLINLKESSEVSLRAATLSKEREDELLKIKEGHHTDIGERQAVKEEIGVGAQRTCLDTRGGRGCLGRRGGI